MQDIFMRGLTLGTCKTGFIHAAGSVNTWSTTIASTGMIGGKHVVALGITTGGTTPVLDATTGEAFPPLSDNQATVIVWGQNAAGTIQASQGGIEDTEVGITVTAGAFKRAPAFPSLPDDFMVLAYQLIRTAPSASAFTFGTSNWNATGITVSTAVNCGVLPERPQTS